MTVAESSLIHLEISISLILIIDHDKVRIQNFKHAIGKSSLMTGSVVTLISTFDVTCINEIQKS